MHKRCGRIALDSNMLLAIQALGADVFGEARKMFGSGVEFFVPTQVFMELGRLEKKGVKMKKAVAVAREAISKNGVKNTATDAESADSALLRLSVQGYCIATNDRALRKKIKGFGGTVIYLRQRKFLESE